MTETLRSLKAALARARRRGDDAEVRRLLEVMAATNDPQNALAPRTTETRED